MSGIVVGSNDYVRQLTEPVRFYTAALHKEFRIGPMAVCGKLQIQREEEFLSYDLVNPTNGSWWIVQIRPKNTRSDTGALIPPTAVGGSFRSQLQTTLVIQQKLQQWKFVHAI